MATPAPTPDKNAPRRQRGAVLGNMAEALEQIASLDAARRQIIDDMTYDTYVTPKGADRVQQSVSDPFIASLYRRITDAASKITILAPTHTKEVIRVQADPQPQSLTPQAFTEAYELLHDEVFGTGAVVQDENAIHGLGRANRGRISSDQTETRGGAVQKRKLSASRRAVIKDQRAFNEKTKIDKRLRKMAKEIYDFLNKEKQHVDKWWMRCAKCKKHAEDDWQFCPRCGAETERMSV